MNKGTDMNSISHKGQKTLGNVPNSTPKIHPIGHHVNNEFSNEVLDLIGNRNGRVYSILPSSKNGS
jgi:hypothetical protein